MLPDDPLTPAPAPPRPAPRLARAPGVWLRRLARLWTSRSAYSAVFAPILDEMEVEYFAALAADDVWLARCVLVRGRVSFWLAPLGELVKWVKGLFF